MIRSFVRLVSVDMGFDPAAIVTLQATPVNPMDHGDYYPSLLKSVRTIPGVSAAGAADFVPLLGSSVVMAARLDSGESTSFASRVVLPGYFEALGVPLRRGRLLEDADVAAGRSVALVNEAAERSIAGEGSAIGRRVTMSKVEHEIVGVVGSFRHMGPSDDLEPELYRLSRGTSEKGLESQGLTIVVRSDGTSPNLGQALRQAAASVGPRALVGPVKSGRDWFADTVVTPRQRTVLLALLGGLGLVLTLVGVLGVTAYAVARRTQEIGLRMALAPGPGRWSRGWSAMRSCPSESASASASPAPGSPPRSSVPTSSRRRPPIRRRSGPLPRRFS
jgi:hypothetical protein